MNAILVRVGVDQAYGGWNAPIDPLTHEFVYVPIPEVSGTKFLPKCETPYSDLSSYTEAFCEQHQVSLQEDLRCPMDIWSKSMHLDPDFSHLTYGDVGDRRGSGIRKLVAGDLLVFYAGLRPIRPCSHKLIYAIIGLFVVDRVITAADVSATSRHENAHTRKLRYGPQDIVVRAVNDRSGRLLRGLPIGEFRDRAYRVRRDLLEVWGGLSVNDGYIQRSARPPRFLDAARFYRWFQRQQIPLIRYNNPCQAQHRVVIVHLRQPDRRDPNETRADPFWEFGSFGCTGCHRSNVMNPRKLLEMQGVRLGFAQGGPDGFRLVHLTPPVTVWNHAHVGELRWEPAFRPFRYEYAPRLIDRNGRSDYASIKNFIKSADRSTWLGKFSSCFRSRRTPLPEHIAKDLINQFDNLYESADPSQLASAYEQALPYMPSVVDCNRLQTYMRMLSRGSDGRGCTPLNDRIEQCQAILKHFHELIRRRTRRLTADRQLVMPSLQSMLMTAKSSPAWFAVPTMHGGFSYWLETGDSNSPVLICESWCRVVEGSEQRHQITVKGIVRIIDGVA